MVTERFHVSKAGDTHTHTHTHTHTYTHTYVHTHVHKRPLNYISRNDTLSSISVDIAGYTDATGIGRYQ